MKLILAFLFLLIPNYLLAQGAQNQSGYTEREKTQQQIESNRREVERAGDAHRPNSPSSPMKVDVSNIDSNVMVTIDHKALVYEIIREAGTNMIGGKFTSGVALGFYKDPNGTKWRLTAGMELPGDYVWNNLIYYVGGGAQLGRKGDQSGIYINAGLDHRVLSWAKLQYGINWVVGGNLGLTAGLGLTF